MFDDANNTAESSKGGPIVKAKIVNVRKEEEGVNDHLDVIVDPSGLGEEDDQVGGESANTLETEKRIK